MFFILSSSLKKIYKTYTLKLSFFSIDGRFKHASFRGKKITFLLEACEKFQSILHI